MTRLGTFYFEVMPFALINARDMFQKLMEELLEDLSFECDYLDDVIIHSNTTEDHVAILQVVF